MKSIATLFFCGMMTIPIIGLGQNSDKIKVALLGTVHFTPSSVDMYKNQELAVSGEKRQNEITYVTDKIAAFNPDQICIEYPVSEQNFIDSLYHEYLNGKYQLKDDEIDQLGLKSAQKLGLEKLTCVNYYGNFDSDKVMEYAQSNDQMHIAEEMGNYAETFMSEINSALEKKSIGDFLIYLNSEKALNTNASFYTKHFIKIGKNENYMGTDLVADWYSTNLHIYTNIIRSIKPSDKKIIVLFGQGHIPILKHLFETNPDFEVIEIEEILK